MLGLANVKTWKGMFCPLINVCSNKDSSSYLVLKYKCLFTEFIASWPSALLVLLPCCILAHVLWRRKHHSSWKNYLPSIFLVRLYKSTGRAITITTVSASALATLLKMLKFLVKFFKSLCLLNPRKDLVDTLPDVRYWSEVTITTHISDLEVKGTDFEILN